MAHAKTGDRVTVHYTGRLDNGNVFDTSANREPIDFVIGEKKLIPGFEDAVVEMQPGDKKTITIPCDQAYGPRRDELVITVDRKDIPDDIKPEVGHVLQFQKKPENSGDEAIVIPFTVIAINEANVKLDANHPLAGKDLIFEIELVEIK